MTMPEPVWVACDEALASLCQQLSGCPALAMDTEFIRTDTFYPQLALIQICDGESVWLVDPLAITDPTPLIALLENPAVIKVFHSCSEDLEVMNSAYGVVPAPMFDTQVAAAFLGYGFSKGYAKLVQAALELELDKHETRSDWLQRPLTASQCRYAAEDVYFLIKIYDKLSRKLEQNGRMAWFMEDMSQLVSDARLSPDVDNYYLRIKGAWRLNGNELALLQAMATWREEEARKSNKPRGRIVHDTSLLELARQKPANRHGLSAIEGMKPQSIRRYGETLLDLIDEHTASNRALAELPAPLDREQRQLLSNYREKIEVKSESLDIAPELLARKKELELLVRSQCGGEAMLPPALAMGWRFDVIGKELLENVG